MKKLYILGFGCGDKADITLKTIDILKQSDAVFARTKIHPSAEILEEYGIEYTSFDYLYESEDSFEDIYQKRLFGKSNKLNPTTVLAHGQDSKFLT